MVRVVAVLLTASCVLVGSGASAAEAGQPRGLFVCRGPNATPEREVNFPFVDGWLVRQAWSAVEPRAGEYDWNYIDNEIALARKLGKKVSLAVLGGKPPAQDRHHAGMLAIRVFDTMGDSAFTFFSSSLPRKAAGSAKVGAGF